MKRMYTARIISCPSLVYGHTMGCLHTSQAFSGQAGAKYQVHYQKRHLNQSLTPNKVPH